MDIAQQLSQALAAAFPQATIMVHRDSGGKAYATVVWQGFATAPDRVRQQLIWGKLAQQLTPEALREISLILASTPEEDEVLRDYPPDQD